MEAKHGGAIGADSGIKPEGDNFRVPFEAAHHFNDMVRQW